MAMFLSLFIALLSLQQTASITNSTDHREQIKSLLEKLNQREVEENDTIRVLGPSFGTKEEVYTELLKIAAESADSRIQVIDALIREIEKPPNLEVSYGTNVKWTAAVNLLGDLRATKAINILVKNLYETGEVGFMSSVHYRPVARALEAIGEPAVPRLIEALSEENSEIGLETASTLAGIGKPALTKLIKALESSNANIRGGAGLALGWIGGKEARIAVQNAMARETNKEVLKNLHYAWEQLKRN